MASSYQQLYIFLTSQWLYLMPHPTPMDIRHEVLALAREGMWHSAIAGCMCLTRTTINRVSWWHAHTGALVPGKSTEAPRKTTRRQDRALLRMVQQDCFINFRALTARMRNLYGIRADQKTTDNRLLPCGYCPYRLTRKPLLTANHHHLRLDWNGPWAACHVRWQFHIPYSILTW